MYQTYSNVKGPVKGGNQSSGKSLVSCTTPSLIWNGRFILEDVSQCSSLSIMYHMYPRLMYERSIWVSLKMWYPIHPFHPQLNRRVYTKTDILGVYGYTQLSDTQNFAHIVSISIPWYPMILIPVKWWWLVLFIPHEMAFGYFLLPIFCILSLWKIQLCNVSLWASPLIYPWIWLFSITVIHDIWYPSDIRLIQIPCLSENHIYNHIYIYTPNTYPCLFILIPIVHEIPIKISPVLWVSPWIPSLGLVQTLLNEAFGATPRTAHGIQDGIDGAGWMVDLHQLIGGLLAYPIIYRVPSKMVQDFFHPQYVDWLMVSWYPILLKLTC